MPTNRRLRTRIRLRVRTTSLISDREGGVKAGRFAGARDLEGKNWLLSFFVAGIRAYNIR
jgi:hypothetical protein